MAVPPRIWPSVLLSFCGPSAHHAVPLAAQVPVCKASLSKASGRSLTWAFTKGGAETSRLMNLINLPMDTSATVRKMTGAAAHSKPKPKPTGRTDVNLVMKKELSGVSSLDIKLKPGEVKKLQQTHPSAEQEAHEGGPPFCPSEIEHCAVNPLSSQFPFHFIDTMTIFFHFHNFHIASVVRKKRERKYHII